MGRGKDRLEEERRVQMGGLGARHWPEATGQEKGWAESGVPLARPRQWTGGDRQGGTKGHLKILRLGDRMDDGSWEETVKETSFLL